MNDTPLVLDVRPVLRDGGEPFDLIMRAIDQLAPGQDLQLFATFKPEPLISLLSSKGYDNHATEIAGGDWEVLFTPKPGAGAQAPESRAAVAPETVSSPPAQSMDLRDLMPPEPLVRILAALETMPAGDRLEARLDREPVLLFPELAKRGHSWRGAFDEAEEVFTITITAMGLQG